MQIAYTHTQNIIRFYFVIFSKGNEVFFSGFAPVHTPPPLEFVEYKKKKSEKGIK
jgi:hypothetical protein